MSRKASGGDAAPGVDSLTFVSVEALSPHEEIRPAIEARVAQLLRSSGQFTWPIIADGESGLILDGNHRVAVLRRLGARHVLAQPVAVRSAQVRVDRWCRVFGGVSRQVVADLARRYGLAEVSPHASVTRSASQAFYRYGRRLFATAPADDPYHACVGSRRIETELGAIPGLAPPVFEDEERAGRVAGQAETLVVYPPLLDKEVLLRETGRRLFPPKSTRFLLPYRLIGVPVPLEGLLGERGHLQAILDRAREEGVMFLASGLRVDRVYPEPLYQIPSYRIPADCFADARARREYEACLAERSPQGAARSGVWSWTTKQS